MIVNEEKLTDVIVMWQ